MVILHDAPRLESIPVFKLIDGFLARFLDGEQGMVVCGNQSVQVRYMLPKRRYAKAGLQSDPNVLVQNIDRIFNPGTDLERLLQRPVWGIKSAFDS